MYKSCSRCGKIHDTKYKCNVGRIYKTTEADKLRAKSKWHKKAKEIKERSNYLCAVCKEEGIYTYNNLETHHIEPLKENTDRLLDDYNLICLCTTHHKLADEGKIERSYLFELAKDREDNI